MPILRLELLGDLQIRSANGSLVAVGAKKSQALLAYLGVKLGEGSTAWIKGHTWEMGVLAAALFGVLYALLKWNDRARDPIGGLQ